ncbi:MAG: disulfide bond formation protein B [Nanoarchaeota archaeon]
MASELVVDVVNRMLATLTLAGQVFIVILIGMLFVKRKDESALLRYVKERALLFAFIITVVATAGSLFWSEVVGYTPCKLCWFQRVFIYPQVVLLGVALLRKEKKITRYIIPISVIAGLIAAYHYLMQIGAAPATSCSVVGFSVDCSETFAMHYGYITNPLMALTAAVLIILFMLFLSRKRD